MKEGHKFLTSKSINSTSKSTNILHKTISELGSYIYNLVCGGLISCIYLMVDSFRQRQIYLKLSLLLLDIPKKKGAMLDLQRNTTDFSTDCFAIF